MKLEKLNIFESNSIDTKIITNKMNKWGRKNIESFDTVVKELLIRRGDVDTVYGDMQRVKLNDIIRKYIKLGKSHVMDMTVELLDTGFDDEVLKILKVYSNKRKYIQEQK